MSASAAAKLPEESLYNISDHFINQQGNQMELKDFAGKITVISMIFTHCTSACPRLTSDVKAIASRLHEMGIDNVNYVLVSFDTKRDNPSRLREFENEHELGKNWTLLTANEEAVRQLSVLLNVQYEKAADGNFSHSNLITVLDQRGRIATQLEGLQANNSETIAKIKQLAEVD